MNDLLNSLSNDEKQELYDLLVAELKVNKPITRKTLYDRLLEDGTIDSIYADHLGGMKQKDISTKYNVSLYIIGQAIKIEKSKN